jgi:hypothetical protein
MISEDDISPILFSGAILMTFLTILVLKTLEFVLITLPSKLPKKIAQLVHVAQICLGFYFYVFKFRPSASKLQYSLDNFFVSDENFL